MKKILKSCVSLLLVACMLLGVVPATMLTAHAEEEKPLIYVSMGDSMTNGYCLPGYDGQSGGINYGNVSYANQFAAYLAGYKGAIADDQVIFTGENGTVDHRQLAVSGMRAQDVDWALRIPYKDDTAIADIYAHNYDAVKSGGFPSDWWYSQFTTGDWFTWAELLDYDYRYADAAAKILDVYNKNGNDAYFKSSYAEGINIATVQAGLQANDRYPVGEGQANEIGGAKYLQIASEYYQESVAQADIISLGVGNTNFGTHMLNRILNVVMYNEASFDEEYSLVKAYELAAKDPVAKVLVNDFINGEYYRTVMLPSLQALGGGDASKAERISYIVEYCTVSFITGYISMLNRVLELNPDAQIIQIALMNAYTQEGAIADGTLGQLVQVIYTPMNKLLKALPAQVLASKSAEDQAKYANAKFFFAEAPYVSCMVDVFGDDFYKDAEGNYVEYEGLLEGGEDYTQNEQSIVRERFAEEIIFIQDRDPIFKTLGRSVPNVSMDDFLAGVAAYELMTPEERLLFAASSEANAAIAEDYAYYLGLENALIRCGTGNVTFEALSKLGQLDIESVTDATHTNIDAAQGDILPHVFAALAKIVENVMKEKLAEYEGESLGDIQINTNVEITVDPIDIQNLVMTEMLDADDAVKAEARYNAAKVIAHKVIKEVYVATVLMNGVNGIDTLFSTLGLTACSSVGYYNFLQVYEDVEPIVEDIMPKIEAWNEQTAETQAEVLAKCGLVKAPSYFKWWADLDEEEKTENYYEIRKGILKTLMAADPISELDDAAKKELMIAWADDASDASDPYKKLKAYINISNDQGENEKYGSNMVSIALSNGGEALGMLTKFGLQLKSDEAIELGMAEFEDDGLGELEAGIATELSNNPDLSMARVKMMVQLLALPQAMSDAMCADEIMSGSLTMDARCLLGTGAGGHPSEIGHAALYKAMVDVYTDPCSWSHDYAVIGDDAWTWAEDYSAAAVKLTCTVNAAHTKDVTADVKAETTEATCEEDGKIVYTATATYEGKTYTATKEETLAALEHEYNTREWKSDESGHWHECIRKDARIDFAEHVFAYDTVSGKEKCECGYLKEHVHGQLTYVEGKAATCTGAGSNPYYKCATCDTWFEDETAIIMIRDHSSIVIPAKNHNYNQPVWDWADDYSSATLTMVCANDKTHTVPVEGVEVTSVTTEAKCEVAGKTVYTATASYENKVYTDTKTVEIKAREHSFTTYVPNNDAVCGKDGTKTATCDYEDCDETNTVTDEGTALIHSFTKYISDENATCEKDGTKTATCDNGNCGAKHTVVYEGSALGHSFTDYISDENATCTEDGTKTATCDRDGCGAKDTVVYEGSALDHSFTKYISDKNATCTEDGTKTAICDRNCGAKDTIVDEGSNLGHDYDETTYKWSEDGNSCTATHVCKNNAEHVETATAKITKAVKTPAACETKGTTTYTATFDVEWAAEQTKDVADIPALTHNYGEPTWTWAEDYKSATATFVCGRGCEIDAVIVDKEIEAASKDATCEGKGEVTYTASVTFEGKDYTESETVIGTALGHDYQPVWTTWTKTEDGWTAELNMVCANDETHTYEVEVEVTAETAEATCEKDGEIIYTATSEDGEYTDTKSVKNGDATGHDYGAPVWEWAEDNKSATATFTCANDETHVETVDATVKSEVTVEAACEVKGEITYTATVVFEDETYTDVVKAETPALTHDWEDATCEDPKTCGNCGETEGDALGHDYNEGVCGNCGEADPDYEKPEEPTVPSTPVKPSKPNWTNIFNKWFGNWWGNGDDEEEKCDHSYKAVVTDPTCTEKGYTTHTCSKCGDSYKDSYVNALGHDYEDGKCTECGAKDPNANKPSKPTLPSWGNIFNKWFGNWWGKK